MNYTQVKLPTTAVERDEALLPDWTGGVVTLGTTHYRRKGGGVRGDFCNPRLIPLVVKRDNQRQQLSPGLEGLLQAPSLRLSRLP